MGDGPMPMQTHVVPADAPTERLDRYAAGVFEHLPTRSAARKAAKRAELLVDGEVWGSDRYVRPGLILELIPPRRMPSRVFRQPLEVLYEDDAMAVVLKCPGFPVNGNRFRTIENALPFSLGPSEAPDALAWPRCAHRLDAPTGGALVVAKTASALRGINDQFARRLIHKRYRAILVGRLEGEGEVEVPVEERAARTGWRVVGHTRSLRCAWTTTVECHPITGRKHQIRRHMAHLGHPVLGDTRYGIDGWILRGKGLFLWAVEIGLHHPISGEPVTARCGEPSKFGSFRAREARRWRKHHPPEP